jgi:hypothetical protein
MIWLVFDSKFKLRYFDSLSLFMCDRDVRLYCLEYLPVIFRFHSIHLSSTDLSMHKHSRDQRRLWIS